MSVTYSLKDPQANVKPANQVPTPIVLTFHFQGQRIKIGIGESILPKDWNPKARRPRASATGAASLIKYMDKLEVRIKEVYLDMKANFEPITQETLRASINRDLKKGSAKVTLVQYFQTYIDHKKNSGAKNIGVYNSAYKNFKKFTGGKNFNDISAEWFDRFQAFMQNYREENVVPNGYSPNYISRIITTIREVMAAGRKAGLHHNDRYADKDYKKPSESVQSIYLTLDELNQMYRCDKYTDSEKAVMHRFMIGAFTGLRFSDSSTITLEAVRDGLIYDRNQKTGTDIVVPVHKIVAEIMAMYPDGLPPSLSNQKTNENLKKIGSKAEINTPIVLNKVKGGKMITSTVPKYELITTHTGRRSAATNMSLAGLPDQAIMKITGHKTASSFQKYIRSTSEQSAKAIKDHPFFK